MIGKSLNARFGNLPALAPEVAVAKLETVLASRAEDIVRVRAKDARAIACVIGEADEGVVRVCRGLGLDVKRGGTAVFGLMGTDAAKSFPMLPPHKQAWLAEPCGARETKALLLAGGIALLSIVAEGGKVTVTAVP